jgi:hypothetical protein
LACQQDLSASTTITLDKKQNLVRPTMVSSLSPNRSSPELEELKKSIYDHEDHIFLLSILSSEIVKSALHHVFRETTIALFCFLH